MRSCVLFAIVYLAAPPLQAQWCAAETHQLIASDGTQFARFGFAMDYASGVLVIGAPQHDGIADSSGAAYLFAQTGTAWTEFDKLEAIFDGGAGDDFGWGVATDVEDLFVGAPQDDEGATNNGSVYRFQHDGTAWTQVEKILPADPFLGKEFGEEIVVSGNWLFIGAPGDSEVPTGAGAVYIYEKVAGQWIFRQKPTGFFGGFGFGDALDAEGDWLVIGAPRFGSNQPGMTYVYRYDGSQWVQDQEIDPAPPAIKDRYGYSVAIHNGTVFSATYEDEVFVWNYDGTNWVEDQTLVPGGPDTFTLFGASMLMSGDLAIIGAPFYDVDADISAGAAYLYHRENGLWSRGRRLEEMSPTVGDEFGSTLVLNGLDLLIGAYRDNPVSQTEGAAMAFRLAEFEKYGTGLAGSGSLTPKIRMVGCPVLQIPYCIDIADGLGGAPGFLLAGGLQTSLPLFGGTLLILPPFLRVPHALGGTPGVAGAGTFTFPVPNDDPMFAGITFYLQSLYIDAAAPGGFSFSRGMRVVPH